MKTQVSERNKIGILFSYSEGWIGGTYYFINLVHALNKLPEEQKPHIVIFSESEKSFEIMKATGYPYLSFLSSVFHYSLWERTVNKLSRALLGRNLYFKGHKEKDLPLLFGYYEQLEVHYCKRKLYWIPDLQDKYYPDYIGLETAKRRESIHKKLASHRADIVFSSYDSKADFERFYPNYLSRHHVMHFAVSLPDLSSVSFADVADKYHLQRPYFASPNQFWSHKNHLLVIKAVQKLKSDGLSVKIVFTGNEKTGGGQYASELKQYVSDHSLEENCLFLGFIDRKEQLSIMQNAWAVIQPSLFEGWSTVVEDAKSLNKRLVVSDLPIHKEQVKENVAYFDPVDSTDLSEKIKNCLSTPDPYTTIDYSENIFKFAHQFVSIVEKRIKTDAK